MNDIDEYWYEWLIALRLEISETLSDYPLDDVEKAFQKGWVAAVQIIDEKMKERFK